MSYESTAQPIKIGYLMDFLISEHFPQHFREDLTNPFDMVFGEALANGVIDRLVEIFYREVEGLPKGSVKSAQAILSLDNSTPTVSTPTSSTGSARSDTAQPRLPRRSVTSKTSS